MGADEPPLVTPRRLRGPVALTGRTRRRFLAWGSASTVTCLALCVVAAHHPQLLDQWDHVLALGPDWWRRSASWLEHPLVWVSSAFGTVASAIATVVVAGLLLYWKQGRAAAYVVLTIAGTSLVTAGLKQYVGLARPVVVNPILQYTSSAMPSGHASNIAAAATVTGVLSALFLRRRARRRLVLVVGVIVVVVVGLDRLMLGVHTPTEVVAGYTLGAGLGLLAAYVVNPVARVCVERVHEAGDRAEPANPGEPPEAQA